VNASELLEEPDVGVVVRRWLDVIYEFLEFSPTVSAPQQVAAGDRARASDADVRRLKPFP
jgi:hypothetical protein